MGTKFFASFKFKFDFTASQYIVAAGAGPSSVLHTVTWKTSSDRGGLSALFVCSGNGGGRGDLQCLLNLCFFVFDVVVSVSLLDADNIA